MFRKREGEAIVMSMWVAQFLLRKVGVVPSFRIWRLKFVRKLSNWGPLEFVSGDPQAGW